MGRRSRRTRRWIENRSYSGLVERILREAEETDRREDELYGEDRGDELPEPLRNSEDPPPGLGGREASDLAERKQRPAGEEPEPEPEELEMDLEAAVGRARCCGAAAGRVARSRGASWKPAAPAKPRPSHGDRDDRMIEALERLEENHRVDLAAVETYERWRRTARDTKGRVLKGNSKPFTAAGATGRSDKLCLIRTRG